MLVDSGKVLHQSVGQIFPALNGQPKPILSESTQTLSLHVFFPFNLLVVHVHGSFMQLDPEVNDDRESDVLLSVRVLQN